MKNDIKKYSIVRVGDEYVVQADEQSVLRLASRRRAAKLVSIATELLEAHPVVEIAPTTLAPDRPAVIALPKPDEVP